MLLVTVLIAVVVTVATTVALLLLEPAAPRSEAVRTGAVGGGAVVALHALWLNDRRRRIEEARHELESDTVTDERSTDPDPVRYHLDLSGARLDHLRLEGRRIGRLVARRARFHGITRRSLLDATKPVLFTDAVVHGRLELREAQLSGGVSFRRTDLRGEVVLTGAEVSTFLDLGTSAPATRTGTMVVRQTTRVDGTTGGRAIAASAP